MTTTTDTIRRLAWDGPLGLGIVIPIAIVLALLITWSLRREQTILGTLQFQFFWLLRVVAMLAALWMLLAPSSVITERTTMRQSIAIAADISRSMQTIDHPGSADDLRWTLTRSSEADESAIVAADRALVSITIASQQLAKAAQNTQSIASDDQSLAGIAIATRALDRAKTSLQMVAKESRQRESARSLLRLIDDEAFHQLRQFVNSTHRDRPSSWRDNLSDAAYHASSLKRRTAVVVRQNSLRSKSNSSASE